MLQPLEGRLKWEPTPDGIFVDFRTTNGKAAVKRAVIDALSMVLWMYPLLLLLLFLLDAILGHHRPQSVWQIPLGVTGGMVLGNLGRIFIGRRTLRLTADSLAIQCRPLLVLKKTYSYETRLMHKLRFASAKGGGEFVNQAGEPELQFDMDSKVENCFVGINEAEATALIAKMMEVYPFPKELPDEKSSAV